MRHKDMEILQFTVKTKNSEVSVDLASDLKIDMYNINDAFCEQPAKFAWWATVAAQAKSLVDRKKLDIEKQEDYVKKTLIGELDSEVRAILEMNGEKVTETKVINGIYTHSKYKDALRELYSLKEELIELQSNWLYLETAKEALNHKKDALISLGAQLRTEGANSDLNVKVAQANKIVGRGSR